MKVALVKTHDWEPIYFCETGELDLYPGDQVLIKTDFGTQIGVVQGIESGKIEQLEKPLGKILRKAHEDDFKKYQEQQKEKKNALRICKDLIKKYQLPMKLVDCFFSLEGGKITFAFTADGRVDFRELLKDLTRIFQKSIRLQQVGIRNEAKRLGDFGFCGRELCCQKFLKNLGNVSTELARIQQVSHRGSERISGVCGRLMCCLTYEAPLYEELSKKFPALGSTIKTPQGKGKVVEWHLLRGTVEVEVSKDNRIEISVL